MFTNSNYICNVYKSFVNVIAEAVIVLAIVNYEISKNNGQVAAFLRGV